MQKILFALSAFFVMCGCARPTADSKISLTSVDIFMAVADSVSHGHDVSDSTWHVLTNSEGYVMSGWNKRPSLVRNAMLVAFHPDSISARDTLIHSNIPMNDARFHTSLIVSNYIDMQGHWSELQKFRTSYDYASIEAQARMVFKAFMPDAVDSLLTFPKIGFICGDPECRSKRSGISLDFNYFYKHPQDGVKTLAHEMFHTYREHFEDWDRYDTIPALIFINAIQNEGIADLIDKDKSYDPVVEFSQMGYPAAIAQLYNDAVASTSAQMALLDSLTICYAAQQISRDEFRQQTQAIFPLGGHPNGRYITNLIVAHGHRDVLLNTFASPTEFIKLYNAIAAAEGLHVMSDEFMHIVGE